MGGDFVDGDVARKSGLSAFLPNQLFHLLTNFYDRHVFVDVTAHFFAGVTQNFPRQTELL